MALRWDVYRWSAPARRKLIASCIDDSRITPRTLADLVLIPVARVGHVAVAIVHVVDVITVTDLFMSTAGTVNVLVAFVDHVQIGRTLVPVAVVLVMGVSLVQVVSVAVVFDRHVAASGTVNVLVSRMWLVLNVDCHR